MKCFYSILVLFCTALHADSSVLTIKILFAELTHFVKQLSQKLPEATPAAPSKEGLLGQIEQGVQLKPTGKDVTQNIGPAAKAPNLLQQIREGKPLKKTGEDVTKDIGSKAESEASPQQAALVAAIKTIPQASEPEEESSFEDSELEIGNHIDDIYRSLKKPDFLTFEIVKSYSDELKKLAQRVEKEIHETSIQSKLKNRINALNKIFNFLKKPIEEFDVKSITQQTVEKYIEYLEGYAKDFDAVKLLGLATLPRFVKEVLQRQLDMVQENLGDEKSSLRNTVVLLNKLIELRKKFELQPFRSKSVMRIPPPSVSPVELLRASPEDTTVLLQKALQQRRRALGD